MADANALIEVGLQGKDLGLTAMLSKASASADTFGSKVGGIATAAASLAAGAAVAGIGAIGAGLAASVNAAQDFEKTMSGVKAVSGATGTEMQSLSSLALQLGKDTSFSASESATAIEELVKGGLSIQDVMGGAAAATVNLAAAGEVGMAEAATLAANAMAQFNLQGDDMAHVADLIAGAANASAIDVGQFGFSLKAAGAVASTVGFSFDDLAQGIAIMGKAGIAGSDAGTSLKTMMLNLQPTTEKQVGLFRELGILTEEGGNAFFDASGKVKSMAEVAEVLQTSLAGMTEQQKLAALEVMFGSDAIRAGAILAKEGAAGFEEMAGAMGKVSAESVAAERLNNLSGSLGQLGGSLETAAITIGTAFLPGLRGIADTATSTLNQAMPAIEAFSGALTSAFQTGDWGAFASQLEAAFNLDFSGPTRALEGLNAAVAVVRSEVLPALGELTSLVGSKLGPEMTAFLDFVKANWQPIMAGVAAMTLAVVVPAFTAWTIAAGAAAVATLAAAAPLVLLGTAVALLAAAWIADWGGIQTATLQALGFIQSAIQTAMPVIQQVMLLATQIMAADWSAAWLTIQTLATTAWAAISAQMVVWLNDASTGLVGLLNQAWLTIQTAIPIAWAAIQASLGSAWLAITSALGAWLGLGGGEEGEEGQASGLIGLIGSAWTAIQNAIPGAWAAVLGALQAAWTTVTAGAQAVLFGGGDGDETGGLVGMFTSAWDAVRGGVENVLQAAMNAASEAFRTPIDAAQALIDKIKEVVEWIGNVIEAAKKLPGSIGLPGAGGLGIPLSGMSAPGAIIGAGSGSWGAVVPGGSGVSSNSGTHAGPGFAADIFAATGTPILAPVGGTIYSNPYLSLGGYTAFLRGDDGRHYYFAHALGQMASGRVSAGQQIGAVDSSGNARGTRPHLHFAVSSNGNFDLGVNGGNGNISPDIIRRAQGGWIDRPITGIDGGGRRWTFAEREAEYVIPRSQMRGSGGDGALAKEIARELAAVIGRGRGDTFNLNGTPQEIVSDVKRALSNQEQRRRLGWALMAQVLRFWEASTLLNMSAARLPTDPLAVLACFWAEIHLADGRTLAAVQVHLDAGSRPDVADLLRVLTLDGLPEQYSARWEWFRDDVVEMAVMGLRFQHPVHCQFSIAFPLPEHEAALRALDQRETLAISTDPPGSQAPTFVVKTHLLEELRRRLGLLGQ